jgi:hypothetical protein
MLARRSWRFWFGSLFSIIALLWLIISTDWAATWSALMATNYWLVLAATILNVLIIPIRSLRWRQMFPPVDQPPFGKLTAIMLIGQTINLLVPIRLGDLVRATLVDTKPVSFVLGTQVFRIVLDTIMLAVLIVILLFQVRLPDWWRSPGEALLITSVLVVLAMGFLVVSRRRLLRLLDWLEQRWPFHRGKTILNMAGSFLQSLEVVSNPVTLAVLLALSIVIWVLYATVNYIMLAAVGGSASWLASVFLLVVLMLGIAVPSSPGRVGVYHYLVVLALSVFGVDQATAVSYAILLHFITILLPAGIGALLAWQQGVGIRAKPQYQDE